MGGPIDNGQPMPASFFLPDAEDYFDFYLLPELEHMGKRGWDRIEMTIMSHGAGTQTSVLSLLSNRPFFPYQPGQPGSLQIDLAMFADVGDAGTEVEHPDTMLFLQKTNYMSYYPILRVCPSYWNPYLGGNDGGLYDIFLERETMPFRMYRGCTDQFKVQPQINALEYLHCEAAKLGIDLKFRQIIGYSADEENRAKRFKPVHDFIEPWFPLIEWGWSRAQTLGYYAYYLPQVAYVIGNPERSGCWFCPFQRRGEFDPVTLEPTPRSWMDLYVNQPHLFEAALKMETIQNERRLRQGKKPAFLYGDKPLTYWVGDKFMIVQMGMPFLADIEEGAHPDDDMCNSWGCFR